MKVIGIYKDIRKKVNEYQILLRIENSFYEKSSDKIEVLLEWANRLENEYVMKEMRE